MLLISTPVGLIRKAIGLAKPVRFGKSRRLSRSFRTSKRFLRVVLSPLEFHWRAGKIPELQVVSVSQFHTCRGIPFSLVYDSRNFKGLKGNQRANRQLTLSSRIFSYECETRRAEQENSFRKNLFIAYRLVRLREAFDD
jgi:hypothetical protein